jgi:menaquinone-dependent protoporphyrinogen oxidase
MKVLISYVSKSGAAKTCAELLAGYFTDCQVCNLSKEKPELEDFDVIIIGSGVRMGKIYRQARDFLKEKQVVLLQKNCAYFTCNAYPDTIQESINKNFNEAIKKAAICIESFGGYKPFSSRNKDKFEGLDLESIKKYSSKIKHSV